MTLFDKILGIQVNITNVMRTQEYMTQPKFKYREL